MPDLPRTDTERLIRIEVLLEGIAEKDRDFETRLRRLERIVWIGVGISATAGSAVGSFIGQIH